MKRIAWSAWKVRACLEGPPGGTEACYEFPRPIEIAPQAGGGQFPRS
ncbi:MAG TPA: hypothetical protein VFP65_15350 [Anaeromyxobacteraceae bacterium]|nr:hypothetical protein [Anaeromyxobacteraceae bacterium]